VFSFSLVSLEQLCFGHSYVLYVRVTAVYFEQGRYDDCIKECEEAIEIGREHRADFKLIAK